MLDNTKQTLYSIYSVDPNQDGEDSYRWIESYDRREDAEKLLATLESLNWAFNKYVIKEEAYSE